ncbi:MAG: ribose-5-phosphate isomerase [Candidatus Omnitrophica bacterium CG11_big_fil_rev_8_21_14_0_20_64_10]|nr:MAG: ribose-5-phosphate isomerase [Candidatus Omnitrophica bacterium CG11_big_fil_rev_8_21_14_0_20_64_10]
MGTNLSCRIAVGADHGGYLLKRRLLPVLRQAGWQPRDLGCRSSAPCDYPLYAERVARAVALGRAQRGLLLCKSGGGMGIAANRFPGVRAVVASSAKLARHAREHNDANVLVLGAEGLDFRRARAILTAWLNADFAGGRHARRLRLIEKIERKLRAHV